MEVRPILVALSLLRLGVGRSLQPRDEVEVERRLLGEVQQQFEIQPLPDSKSLDIEIIIQKPIRFEFFVETKKAQTFH